MYDAYGRYGVECKVQSGELSSMLRFMGVAPWPMLACDVLLYVFI